MGNMHRGPSKNDKRIYELVEAIRKKQSIRLNEADLNLEIETNKWTLLHLAVWFNNQVFAEELITAGCDINVLDAHNESPLKLAIFLKNEEMKKLLMQHGAIETIGNSVQSEKQAWNNFESVFSEESPEKPPMTAAVYVGLNKKVREEEEEEDSSDEALRNKTSDKKSNFINS
ncbi:unnamed protein product [Blepharisma stoltei]|uniref:Ankyrin repeat domain-containing protein n=1 Tax=Blepharisma stoltei TaxID=1481888 RepID=A0AAU9JRA8_9CILI|nr:unnamed protein product [Blepharisma stoltei]